ncbi:MAG: MinD/ParA family protein [Desulfatiglandaceae bacterium]
MSRTIAITSGKGGVGKTNISVNLSLYLSRKGYRVCLFDADLGLANVSILLGLQPESTLADVVNGGMELKDIMVNYHGVDVLPGSSGVEDLANLVPSDREDLLKAFGALEDHDFILFDTSAGVSRDVVAFCLASSEVILVVTPEPTSLTDAYALLKILLANGFEGHARVVVNQCKTLDVAQLVYKKFKAAVAKHLGTELSPLGVIFEDKQVTQAVKEQKALLSIFPESRAAKCIEKLGERLLAEKPEEFASPGLGSFWKKCLGLFNTPLNLKGRKDTEKEDAAAPGVEEDKWKGRGTGVPEKTGEKTAPREPSQSRKESRTDPAKGDRTDHLIKSISQVSEELRRLRRAIERGNGGTTPDSTINGASIHKPVVLDFDAFLHRTVKEKRSHGKD